MCKSQSNCAFMNEIDGLNLTGMPTEPVKDIRFKHCPTTTASCCTTDIENELKQMAEAEVVESVRDQIAILKQFLHNYRKIFKEQFKSAISVTQRNLDILFRRTYGPFYISNSGIFEDFFASLATQLGSHNPKEIKSLLGNLFQQIYIKEFSLMNPLRIVTDKELACMEGLQESLRPFGSVPKKIGLLLGRAFNTWTAILQSMSDTENLLDDIKESSWSLTEHCVSALTQMRYCQICAGRSAYLKPCPNYCLDTLWSCLSGFSAIDASFNRFLDSLVQFSGRLKNVHNPYNSLAPTPVQISESIMLFQEKGSLFSSRILLRCFQSDLRVKRSHITAAHKSSSEENLLAPPFDILAKGLVEKADAFRSIVVDFVDKLTRIRGFWRLLSQTLCLDKGLAATTGEMCWTGIADGPYLRRNTKAQKRQRSPDTSASGNELENGFTKARIKMTIIKNQLDAIYNNEGYTGDDAEGSGIENSNNPNSLTVSDDEDWVEGSAFPIEYDAITEGSQISKTGQIDEHTTRIKQESKTRSNANCRTMHRSQALFAIALIIVNFICIYVNIN